MRYLIHVMYQGKHVNKGTVVALQYNLVSDGGILVTFMRYHVIKCLKKIEKLLDMYYGTIMVFFKVSLNTK